MSETTRQTIKTINGKNYRVEIYTKNGGDFPLVDLIRTFFWEKAGKHITQTISFPLRDAAEHLYMAGEIKAENDKLNGNGAAATAQGDGHE